MKVQIRDELSGKHLCATCTHGTVTQFRDGQLLSACSMHYGNSEPFAGEVRACTGYDFTYRHAPHDMTRVGWILEVKKGRVMGFQPPKTRLRVVEEDDED